LYQVFGNSNSLPISLVLSLSQTIKGLHWDKVPGDNDDEVAARGILYLLIFQQLGQLVRWSWGYNVLLAPADKVDGTEEHANSRLEDGQAESEPLLRDTSAEEERDDQIGSGSDDTKVEDKARGKRSAMSSQFGSDFQSGEQTPITNRQHASSVSTGSSDDDIRKPGPPPDLLPTPANGNVKPSGHGGHLLSFPSATDPVEEDIPAGLRGIPARCRSAVRKTMKAMFRLVSETSKSAFGALPGPLQRGLTKTGSAISRFFLGVWSFMNPPLWAMLVAIVVASIPALQRLLFTDGSFVKNSVTSAIKQSGGVAVPLILVVLGGNLARNTLPQDPGHTKEDDKQETKLLVAALISRMLLPIIFMAPLLALTAKYVPISILDDPIFVIVCFLITGAPSALQLAQICQINNVYMGTMSRLLFQSYVVWILPSTLVLVMCALEVVEWAQR
jgi:predicted permease